MKKVNPSSLIASLLPLAFVAPAMAAGTNEVDIGSQVSSFFGFKCIMEFVFQVVDTAIILSGILLLVFLVWGGIEWVTSGGDKGKVESARSRITNAIIGVAVVAVAYAIWKLALYFFGINAPNICSPNPLS